MDIKILITQMCQLFIIMLLGYFLYKIKTLDDNFINKFTRLILDVTMPCLILGSILKLEERQALIDVLIALFTSFALYFFVLPVFGVIIAKILKVPEGQVGLYTFMHSYPNAAFMGFPIILALCGSVGLFYAAIFNLMFNLSVYTLGVWMMNRGDSCVKISFKSFLSPGVLLSLLAMIIYFANINLPDIVDNTVYSVGSLTSVSAMLLMGCSLARMDIKKIFNDWRVYLWTLIRQLLIPLCLWVPLSMVISNQLVLMVGYIIFAMPVANSAVLFATKYDSDTELAAKTVFITTLFSLVSVPICVMLVM